AAREGHLRRRTPEPAPWASSVRSVGNGHFGHSRRPGEALTPGRELSPLETCAGPDPATPPVRRTTRRGAMLLRKIIGPVGTFGLVAVAALALAAPAQAAAQDQTSVTEDQTLVTDCETTATSHEDCGWKFDAREPKVRDASCDHEKGCIRIPDAEDALYFINGKKAEPGKHWLKPGIYEVVAIKKKLVLS